MKLFQQVPFLILFLVLQLNGQENQKYIQANGIINNFNKPVRVFGDKVKLRSAPNTQSEVLKILRIGEEITLLTRDIYHSDQLTYNGLKWDWYKVKQGNKIGYILGGLISQETKKIGNSMYVTSLKEEKEGLYLLVRLINKKFKYSEIKIRLGTKWSEFSIATFNNRGVPNIEDIVHINIKSNFENRECYLFNDSNKIKKAIELRHHEDGGSYLFHEFITFPNDKEGEHGKIKYRCVRDETGKSYEDVNIKFVWKGQELKSNIEVMKIN